MDASGVDALGGNIRGAKITMPKADTRASYAKLYRRRSRWMGANIPLKTDQLSNYLHFIRGLVELLSISVDASINTSLEKD